MGSFLKDSADIDGLSEEVFGTLSARSVDENCENEVSLLKMCPLTVNKFFSSLSYFHVQLVMGSTWRANDAYYCIDNLVPCNSASDCLRFIDISKLRF